MGMKNRGVSFNLEDPAQADLHKYTLQFKNFSSYVKGLIERDRAIRTRSTEPQKIMQNEPGSKKVTIRLKD